MSVRNYKGELRESILGLLWRQWSALGVMGHSGMQHDAWAIDPEALLLVSALFCRYDQRLYDLVLSWMRRYGQLLTPTRVKALLRTMPQIDTKSLAYIAAVSAEAGDKRWRNLADELSRGNALPEPLFRNPDDEPIGHYPQEDPFARGYGFIRNEFRPQNKLHQQLPESNATLVLRVRGVFGVSARADIITQLMLRSCTISELIDASGYARSSIKEELAALEAGAAVTTAGLGVRNLSYVLVYAESLHRMMKTKSCQMVHWRHVYSAVLLLWQLVSELSRMTLSEDTIRGELSLLFRDALQNHFLKCGLEPLQKLSDARLLTLPSVLETL